MTTAYDSAWVCGGGLVEGLGRGSTPVGDQGALIIVGQSQSADVSGLAIGEVEPAEAESGFGRLQRLQSLGIELDEGVLLGQRRGRARRLIMLRPPEVLTRPSSHLVESVVEGAHHRAFGGELSLSADSHGMPPKEGEGRSCRTVAGTARRGALSRRGGA